MWLYKWTLCGALWVMCSAATWEQAGSPSRQNHAHCGPSISAPVCRREALTCRPPLWPTAGRYVANEADRPRDIQMWRTGCNRWQYGVAITVSAVRELWNCFADSTAVWRQSLWAFAFLTVQLFLSLSFSIHSFLCNFFSSVVNPFIINFCIFPSISYILSYILVTISLRLRGLEL